MFTIEDIDFNEPLLNPEEKYYDLLWPKIAEDDDSNFTIISTCNDNPNLHMICRLKNEEQTVSARVSVCKTPSAGGRNEK